MRVIRSNEEPRQLNAVGPTLPSELYFFYEKNTGVAHFHVEAGADGQFPVEQAAGLLAMHCMIKGQSPSDYVVMVRAANHQLHGLTEKAEKLLRTGHRLGNSVKLTPREEEVLGGLMRSLANKEIAASLNLSERTVKFHVSSLLAKYHVRGRMELVREAIRRSAAPLAVSAPLATHEASTYAPAPAPPAYRSRARTMGRAAFPKQQMSA